MAKKPLPRAQPQNPVRTEQFLYVRNLNPASSFSNNVTVINPMFKTWLATGKKEDLARAQSYLWRPPEELYDVQRDPAQLTNLAGRQELLPVKEALHQALLSFMRQQGEAGEATEMEAFER